MKTETILWNAIAIIIVLSCAFVILAKTKAKYRCIKEKHGVYLFDKCVTKDIIIYEQLN